MAEAHYLSDKDGKKFYPYAHASATYDNNGNTVENRLKALDKTTASAVQSVKIGTTEYKSGTTVTLPSYPTSLPASDVPSWAKQKTKPTYTASEIGLGNVGNFKAVSTVASQGLTDIEKSNARANIGAQVAGSYASANHNHDDKYQAKGSYASASHTHDDRYYTETEINTKLNGKANSSHTHGNGDITSLDASKITSGTISIDRLPQGALERLTVVADDTARFKLTSTSVQKGDTVKVTSTGKMYYVVDETKLSTEAGYEVYAAGTAASVPWSGVTGKPSTYTPSSHTHDDRYYTESEINTKLGGKANSSHTHTKSEITDFPTSMPASDVYAWAKASSKPSYTKSEVGLGNVNNTADANKSVKYATNAGSANAVAWSNVSGKPAIPESEDYSSDNIETLLKKVMGLTPRMGSACFTKDTHVGNKWWNFFYIPHRTGVGDDNGDYGTLLLFPMTENGLSYIVRACKGGVIASISSIITSSNISSQSVASATTVNGHTVNSNVPANAKFTDTNTWRPLGTTADTACAGNDSRLSNARPANGGTASFANTVWTQSHQGSWYINSNWDGSNFITNAKSSDGSVLPIWVNKAGYADSAGSANSVAWANVSGKPSTFTPSSHSHSYNDLTNKPTLGSAASKTVRTLSASGASGWKDLGTDQGYVPDMAFMAYWNGAYSGSLSNLAYCNKGAFGTAATANKGDFATASHTHSNYLTGINKSMVVNALGYTPPTTDTNTWRGVQNNLTSTATDQSLSAYQGKVLRDMIHRVIVQSSEPTISTNDEWLLEY